MVLGTPALSPFTRVLIKLPPFCTTCSQARPLYTKNQTQYTLGQERFPTTKRYNKLNGWVILGFCKVNCHLTCFTLMCKCCYVMYNYSSFCVRFSCDIFFLLVNASKKTRTQSADILQHYRITALQNHSITVLLALCALFQSHRTRVCLLTRVPVCPLVCLPASHLSVLEGATANTQGLGAADTFTPSIKASSESAVPVHLYCHLQYSCTVLPPPSITVLPPPGSTVHHYWHLQAVS